MGKYIKTLYLLMSKKQKMPYDISKISANTLENIQLTEDQIQLSV